MRSRLYSQAVCTRSRATRALSSPRDLLPPCAHCQSCSHCNLATGPRGEPAMPPGIAHGVIIPTVWERSGGHVAIHTSQASVMNTASGRGTAIAGYQERDSLIRKY
eukprot:gene763-biopygen953